MTVIVGVDGSEHSKQALRLAADEARIRGGTLTPVYVYTSPSLYYRPDVFPTAGAEQLAERTRRAAREELERALADVREATEGLRLEPKTFEDPQPAFALVDLATPDDLLVVGSRGRGGFKGLLLGSVSQQCVQHAPCPVMIVRPPADVAA
jgi:nucleotide-binding universal stress UspA family protein